MHWWSRAKVARHRKDTASESNGITAHHNVSVCGLLLGFIESAAFLVLLLCTSTPAMSLFAHHPIHSSKCLDSFVYQTTASRSTFSFFSCDIILSLLNSFLLGSHPCVRTCPLELLQSHLCCGAMPQKGAGELILSGWCFPDRFYLNRKTSNGKRQVFIGEQFTGRCSPRKSTD